MQFTPNIALPQPRSAPLRSPLSFTALGAQTEEYSMSKCDIWKSPQIVPVLAYDDVPKAVEWLTRVFGFHERTEARLTGDGWVLTWMELGDGLVRLSTAGGHDLRSPKSVGGISQSLRVYVEEIDRHFDQAKAEAATIISAL